MKPEGAEVLLAIESLYNDQLKPFGRILRKRIGERALAFAAGGRARAQTQTLPDVDIVFLKDFCESSANLCVEPEEGGDWSAVFVDRPADFVDIYSPEDSFPASVWEEAAEYFSTVTGKEAQLPGGRYCCAQALADRNLPFLQGQSLGKICHLVQIGISQKKLLGYCNGSVVPYSHSQSMVKEQCAALQTAVQRESLPAVDWDVARTCLREILDGPVPLSNVKRLFRSRFQLELSETALGHSKLSELLSDERFEDVCRVQLVSQGYIVSPVVPVPWRLACPAALDLEQTFAQEHEPMQLLLTPLGSPGAPTPTTRSRWGAGVAALHWKGLWEPEETLDSDATESTADSTASAAKSSCGQRPDWPAADDPPMKVQLSSRTKEETLLLQSLQGMGVQMDFHEDLAEEPPTHRRLAFCPDEPLTLEDAGIFLNQPFSTIISEPERRQAHRDVFSMASRSVKNTFIHTAATPVTPAPSAARRCRSVPKDLGSERSCEDVLFPALGQPVVRGICQPSPGHEVAASAVASPAFLPPPTPSTPIYLQSRFAPLLYERSRVIHLADLLS